ncbi:condensation domain-containing protein, partial [Marinobacter sp. NFXS9]|uniref:condensation domain-containing protein n=1 Tax=Marinobacter sp. NFXS9 TaxID=2818433 RepID=UPI0032DF2D94
MNDFYRDCFPLSSVQEMVYLEQLIDPSSPHLVIGASMDIEGDFDFEVAKSALVVLSKKWPCLRSHLVSEGDCVKQVVRELSFAPLVFEDFSGEYNAVNQSRSFVRRWFERPIDMLGDCLWRVIFVKVSQARFTFSFCFHHIIADGLSVSLFIKEFVLVYNRIIAGVGGGEYRDDSYFNYVYELSRYYESRQYERDRDFWLSEFTAIPDSLLLPKDTVSDDGRLSNINRSFIQRAEYDSLRRSLADNGLSPSAFFVAVVAVYFLQVLNRDQLIVGVPVHNRLKAKYKDSIGMFSSVVPLKVSVNSEQSFRSLVESLTRKLRQVYRHQRFPVSDINRALRLAAVGRKQLYDVLVSFEDLDTEFPLSGACYKAERLDEYYSKTPLAISVLDSTKMADVEVIVNNNLSYIDSYDAPRLADRLELLIKAFNHDLDRVIGRAQIVDNSEREQLLYGFNDTTVSYPQDRCIHELFEAQAERRPDAIALVFG